MGEDARAGSAAVRPARDPAEIQREIEESREQLGDTVEALAQKADVKAQVKQRIEDAKASASRKKEQLFGGPEDASPAGPASAASQVSQRARENPVPFAVAAAFAAGFLAARAFGH